MQFVRSSGPGGQNVNKVATAVQLRFDLSRAHLPPGIASRLRELASHLLTSKDELVIIADRQRSQYRNRVEALDRLDRLLIDASKAPRARVPTRVSRAAKKRRVDNKKRRGESKRLRSKPGFD